MAKSYRNAVISRITPCDMEFYRIPRFVMLDLQVTTILFPHLHGRPKISLTFSLSLTFDFERKKFKIKKISVKLSFQSVCLFFSRENLFSQPSSTTLHQIFHESVFLYPICNEYSDLVNISKIRSQREENIRNWSK